jgi:hypothetical protein
MRTKLVISFCIVFTILLLSSSNITDIETDFEPETFSPQLSGGVVTIEYIPSADISAEYTTMWPLDGIVYTKLNSTWALRSTDSVVQIANEQDPIEHFNVSISPQNTTEYYNGNGLLKILFDPTGMVGTYKCIRMILGQANTIFYDGIVVNESASLGETEREVELDLNINSTNLIDAWMYMDVENSSVAIDMEIFCVSLFIIGIEPEYIVIYEPTVIRTYSTHHKTRKIIIPPGLKEFLDAYGIYFGTGLAAFCFAIIKLVRSNLALKKKQRKRKSLLTHIREKLNI